MSVCIVINIAETQVMSHIVESCPLTKLNGGLSQLHSADDAAIAWLTKKVKVVDLYSASS